MKTSGILKTTIYTFIFLTAISCMKNSSSDWPEWRGPNRDGKVTAFATPSVWPENLKKIWQTEVGFCNSSPVMVGTKIYLHVRQDSSEVALCLDKTNGIILWENVLNPAPEVTGGASSHPGPRSTPAVANEKIFLLGTGGIVSCLDAETGDVIWKVLNYTEVPRFYTAASPLVVGNQCILPLGGSDNGVIVSFNIDNGEEIWKVENAPCTYSSPVLMEVGNQQILVVQTETDVLGLTLDGKELYKIPTPAERRYYNSTTPVIDGMNIIIAGRGSGTWSYKIGKNGETYSYSENWNNPDFGGSFNTPVLKKGYLYGNEGRLGKLYCLNAETGATSWADTTSYNRFASTLDLGKAMLSLPANGKLIIYKPDPQKFEPIKIYDVSNTEIYAHPLLEGKSIYIKDEKNLTCWSVE